MRGRARRKDLPAPVRVPRTDLHAYFWMMRFCKRFAVTCRAKRGPRFIPAVFGNSQVRLAPAYASTSRLLLRRPSGMATVVERGATGARSVIDRNDVAGRRLDEAR